MSIMVASILNAKGKRSDVAKLLGVKRRQVLNNWVTKGSIPAKYALVLIGPDLVMLPPEVRKIFGFVEPKED